MHSVIAIVAAALITCCAVAGLVDVPRVEFEGPGVHTATIELPCLNVQQATVTVTYVFHDEWNAVTSVAPHPIWSMGGKSAFAHPFALGGSCTPPASCTAKTWLNVSGSWKANTIDITLHSTGGTVVVDTTLTIAEFSMDLNCDGIVGVDDLLIMLGAWGDPWGVPDLLKLLQSWGKSD
jgi:hypothetical protein